MAVDLPAVLDIDGNRNGIVEPLEIQALAGVLDNGTYVFGELASGEHHVRVASDPAAPLEPHETLISLQFLGSVSGVKWDDLNANGARDPGEPGVGGVRIYADQNSNGVFNDGEPFTITRVDGSYSLVLPPGVVSIREVTPPGTVQTFPLTGASQGFQQSALFAGEALSSGLPEGASRHNGALPADVNGDGAVSVVDALYVVQEWRLGGPRPLSGEAEFEPSLDAQGAYVDVNADSYLSIADVWSVVDVLRGEGEAVAVNDTFSDQAADPFTVQANTSQNALPVLANDFGGGELMLIGLGTLAGGIVGASAQGDQGGQITIQSGGAQGDDVVLYTPRPDFYGIEQFIYEVRDESDGTTDRGEVRVRVIPDRDYASFTFQAFQTDGVTPITSVETGEEFIVRVFVQDERTNFMPASQRGVFSAYLDVTYDESLLDLAAIAPSANPHGFSRDVRFGPDYQELVSVDQFAPGLVDEAGATQTDGFEVDTQPLGPGPVLFLEARFRATDTGLATFGGNPADDPLHQFVFFRPSNLEPLDPDFIDFGQLNVTITPPVGAVPDAFTRNEDLEGPAGSPLTDPILDVLANDIPFTAGQPLRIAGLGPGNAQTLSTAAGTLEVVNDGQEVLFTPTPNFHGSVNFTYTVTDGVQSETAVVSLTVASVNDAPVANNDSFTADNETILSIAAPGVLANDFDADGDSLLVVDFQSTSALGAQVSVNPNGRFTYNPLVSSQLQSLEPGEVLIDTFTYTVSDGNGGQATATVRLFVSTNTGGSHIVEIVAGQNTTGINFGNNRIQGEGEWEATLEAIATDISAVAGSR